MSISEGLLRPVYIFVNVFPSYFAALAEGPTRYISFAERLQKDPNDPAVDVSENHFLPSHLAYELYSE
jgi:hypothetical protein